MDPARRHSELELFEAIGRGDMGAFRELSARIERYVRSRLWKTGESAVQEACGRIWQKLEELRPRRVSWTPEGFRAYFNRILASQVVETLRGRRGEVSLEMLVDLPGGGQKALGDLAVEQINSAWDGLQAAEEREEHAVVREAFGRLGDRCRQLLWARAVEHRPERDIAASLAMSLENVWVSLHRCREQLARMLFAVLAAPRDDAWQTRVSQLASKLVEPLATVFRLWWEENRTIREMARQLGRDEREVKDLLGSAKASVWQLAQETAGP